MIKSPDRFKTLGVRVYSPRENVLIQNHSYLVLNLYNPHGFSKKIPGTQIPGPLGVAPLQRYPYEIVCG